MKIAIDCRLIGQSGIGTFIENVVCEIIKHKEHEFILIGNSHILKEFTRQGNCKIVECTYRSFSLKELFLFPTGIVNKCDAFFTPNFNIPLGIKIPISCTIHDIVFFDTKNFGTPFSRFIIKRYILRALRISKNVFTVSNFSKSRIETIFPIRKDIHVIYNVICNKLKLYKSNHKSTTERKGIVFLGNLKKHKGIGILLDAYEKLIEDGCNEPLTIIGKLNFRSKDDTILPRVKKLGKMVRIKSNASDEDVYRIISQSKVLVSPSLYEGFGLPPLEALYLGTSVIISDIPVYKEVYSSLPVTFFKSEDSYDLYTKLKEKINTKCLVSIQLINKLYNISSITQKLLDIICK